MSWWGYALLSAVAAAATAILAKVGVKGVPSNLVTAIRTVVVVVFVVALVAVGGEYRALSSLSSRSLLFLVLSGLATGLSWLAGRPSLADGATLTAPGGHPGSSGLRSQTIPPTARCRPHPHVPDGQ